MDKIAAYNYVLSAHPLWVSDEDLIKSASADEVEVYEYLVKVAEYGSEEEIHQALREAYAAGLDKEGGLMARGLTALGGALNRVGLTGLGRRASVAGVRSAQNMLNTGSLRALQNEDVLRNVIGRGNAQVRAALPTRRPAVVDTRSASELLPARSSGAAPMGRSNLVRGERPTMGRMSFGPAFAF